MDYAKALNSALGVADAPEVAKKTPAKSRLHSASKSVDVRQPNHIDQADSKPFDIATYVPNKYLQEALAKFPGSILNISPINGAIEFIFGR